MNEFESAPTEQLGFGFLTDEWPEDPLLAEGHLGQWRLARVEVANWGTFCGYHSLDIHRKGLLITGASGSGKSSLLDAITMVLTPPRNRHLNAAARSGSSKGEDRTPPSYIRGAYKHEENSSGEIASSFLRPRTATWSGIMLRYENGLETSDKSPAQSSSPQARPNEPVNLLALFNLKAGSNSTEGLSQAFAVIRGTVALPEFEAFAVNGIDSKRLKAACPTGTQVFREHSAFETAFCRQLGISGPKTLELLHKTQAAKNFGSLDELFRNFMLDRPKTFDQAEDAVEQFTALSQAHAGVVSQREQMRHLEPLVEIEKRNAQAADRAAETKRLTDCLSGCTAQLAFEVTERERAVLLSKGDQLQEALNSTRAEQQFAHQALDQAQRALGEAGGGALDLAESQLLTYEKQHDQVHINRERLLVDLRCAQIEGLPRTYAEWQELRRTLGSKATEAQAEQDANQDDHYRSYGRVPDLQGRIESVQEELRYLRQRQTNIPQKLNRVREAIALHLGIDATNLPFVGELVSVKPEYDSWRGAIERLLENGAKTLLVSSRNIPAVSRYVESHHLGTRLEFISVPSEVEVPKRSFGQLSLVNRLSVKQHAKHPEFSHWTSRHLRERYDYACVDSPDDLSNHRFALTIAGQIKRDNRYVKDDRHPLDDRTRWVLGYDNDGKIEQFSLQLETLQKQLTEARKTAQALSEKTQRARDLQRAKTQLDESDWSNYDIASVEEEYRKAKAFYEQLSRGNTKLEEAMALRDDARQRSEAADAAANKAQLETERNAHDLAALAQQAAQQTERMQKFEAPTSDEADRLRNLFQKVSKTFDRSVQEVYQTSTEVQSHLYTKRVQAQSEEQKTRNAAERIEHDYHQRWPLESADLTTTFDDIDAYLAMYHQIKATGLPDYEQRFLHVLHDFGQDQITVIASTIRHAFREVQDKLIPVNSSLGLSKYSPTTHLQIKAKDAKSAQVLEFLDNLKEITRGTWDESDIAAAEKRFNKTNDVIKRLKSSEYADVTWRKACLDTRQHVSFIANEIDTDGNVVNVHSSDTGLSGGQKQKLVIFCLAAALRYQLADENQPAPRFGTVVLDEAFDKADPAFARIAMDIFQVFGFHMILATPYKLVTVLAPYLGAIAVTTCKDSKYSSLSPVSFTEDVEGVEGFEGSEGVRDTKDAETHGD